MLLPENRPVAKSELDLILNKLNEITPEIRGFRDERILLTGATGFFGKWLTQTLLKMNDAWGLQNELIIVSRDRDRALAGSPWLEKRSEVRWLECDIRRLAAGVKSAGPVNAGAFTTVIHGAAAASRALNEGQPQEMFDTIVDGTRQILGVLEAMGSGKAGGTRLQFLSSGAVYGPQPADCPNLPESYRGSPDVLDQKAAYGEGKRAAELLCASAARRLDVKLNIARCYAFVGAYLPLDTHFAAGNFMRNVLLDEPISIGGDGTPMRSYLYAGDLMVWLLTLILRAPTLRAYNVGSDHGVSILETARAADQAGMELKPGRKSLGSSSVTVAKSADPNKAPERYVPAIERARREFGLEPWTSLTAAFRKTLEWHMGETASASGSGMSCQTTERVGSNLTWQT